MKEKNKQKGITLIALVITIIILLILAGISIASLTGSGLFEKAKEAKEKSQNAQDAENATLGEYEQWMANYAGGSGSSGGGETGGTKLASKVQPGDYVTYTPDDANTTDILSELTTYSGSTANTSSTLTQETGLKWRVLDVVDGKVRLISEMPTTSKVTLYSYNGYNNAVYLLDKTCKTLYSKARYSENVQNLKIEDIQNKMSTDYTTINSNYGQPFTPASKKYPSILAQEAGQTVNGGATGTLGLSEQTTPINQTAVNTATSWTVKYTYWNKTMAESNFTNPIYYNLFINNGSPYPTYWMSSRCVDANSGHAIFDVRRVDSGDVSASNLYYSDDDPFSYGYALRPVVTLNSNVLVKSGEGTPESAYEI